MFFGSFCLYTKGSIVIRLFEFKVVYSGIFPSGSVYLYGFFPIFGKFVSCLFALSNILSGMSSAGSDEEIGFPEEGKGLLLLSIFVFKEVGREVG